MEKVSPKLSGQEAKSKRSGQGQNIAFMGMLPRTYFLKLALPESLPPFSNLLDYEFTHGLPIDEVRDLMIQPSPFMNIYTKQEKIEVNCSDPSNSNCYKNKTKRKS